MDLLFQISNVIALLGWIGLTFAPRFPAAAQRLAGLIIPMAFGILYAIVMTIYFPLAKGGFSSLPDVMALFTSREIALAGWLHYLAFDLLIGAWITRTAASEGMCHLFVLPCLALTFLFGPVGFLAFHALRLIPRNPR